MNLQRISTLTVAQTQMKLSEKLSNFSTQLEPTVSSQKAFQTITNWTSGARWKQLSPVEEYNIWLILAGRGWGKTRTGAEDCIRYAFENPNTITAVVAPTFGDLRRVCFGGVSGFMAILPDEVFKDGNRETGYSVSRSEINLWNGSKIIGFSATEPNRLRGSQFHRAWCDELAAWQYPETFDQLMFGLRLGEKPQCVITTTPRPIKIITELLKRNDIYITRGSTFENEDNLAKSALDSLKERYENTTMGRQELYAEVLTDFEGALWSYKQIEECRVLKDDVPELQRVVVAIDPAVTAKATSDETGILVVGKGEDNRYYVLDDSSGKMSADAWARRAVDLFYLYKADRIVAETNNGGDLVERLIRSIDGQVPYKSVHATRGKLVRAEPISALYEQKKVHHVGSFSNLEDQMISYTGEKSVSPDRLDALVWGLTELSKSSGQVSWRIS